MEDAIREMLLIMLSYVGVIVVSFGIMNWLMGGKLIPFIKVKLSMGKKLLVHIRTMTHDYYKAGQIVEQQLIVKDLKGETRRLDVLDPACIYRASGVNNIVIDDAYNTIFNRQLDSTKGFDAIKNEHLHVRALYKPLLNNKMEKIMLVLLAVVLIIGLASVFFGFQNNELLKALEVVSTQAPVIS
jgi:hypothetical protein